MKKLLYITLMGILLFSGFTWANIENVNLTPTTQSAISGSMVSFSLTWHNGTGDMYLKYALPKTSTYDVIFSSATLTPINQLMLWLSEHDPIFFIPSNSNFSVAITAKVKTSVRSFSVLNAIAAFSDNQQFTTILTSAVADITPIPDLMITNILTWQYPSYSGDIVSYYITIQNIWSTTATGITFMSNFPIPTLFTPTAIFNGTPYTYNYINYPQDFVWSWSYLNSLNPWQIMTIRLQAPMTQNYAIGTTFTNTVKTTTVSSEYTTGNNSASATWAVQALSDVRVTKTLTPFSGYRVGDIVTYTITYGNSWGKSADNVNLLDIMNGQVQLPTTNFNLGTLPAGSGGTIILTGTLTATLTSWTNFVNTATISTSSIENATGNNSAIATGTIQGRAWITLSIIANNLDRTQLDNAPYGSWPAYMIQAVSGDHVQFTITYANNGNIPATNSTLSLWWIQAFTTTSPTTLSLNLIPIDHTWTVIFTGIVWPKNYISFSPTVSLAYTSWQTITDTITITEPLICGDGILTRTEQCDTQGNLGVIYSGQTCENQQWQCVLVTHAIVNLACVNYQYSNPAWGIFTGQSCSSVNNTIENASCTSMTWSTPTPTNTWYAINYTCKGSNTLTTTPITITCGNGTSISGIWSTLNGTCTYASSFMGNAQCSIGSDTNNTLCRVPVAETQLQCDLEALDGRIILVDDNWEGEGRFRCETRNANIAQKITIDCGQNGQWNATAYNTSQIETICSYDENTPPEDATVTCSTNDIVCETENIIIDEPILGYCGDGEIDWYEDCDDGDDNGTSRSNCTAWCDLKDKDMVGCFNVGNMNISIQKWELLPFRWMLDKEKNIIPGSTCENKPDGKIPEESMYCTFSIYNGSHTEAEWNHAYTVTKKCNENNWNGDIFNYFNNQSRNIWSLQNAFGKYAIDSNNFVDTTFGEYKIVLEKVEYDYCRSDEREEKTAIDRVCSVNFTVTQPYLAQKSSFGVTPKATNITLNGYQTLNGEELIKTTDLADIMVLDESEYDGGNKVDAMINTFITKYNKLAIEVPQSSLKNTAFEGLDIIVKIVPQQKIYILQSDTKKTITLQNIKKFTAPFTIVTKNIDLVIKWNVDYNGMFLVKWGTVTFEQADVSGADRCPSQQIVKGIFVTDGWFVGTNPALQNDTNSKNRCSHGNLQVKGILMWDNIQSLVDSRRSQLNDWFYTKSATPTAIKTERRNEIFNGAAVLIEYSPSLWSSLPPGASEFTKTLDVYKR